MAPEQISLSQFEASLPSLLEDILNASKKYDIPAEAEEWFSNSLKINAAGGKCNRGMSVHDTVAELVVDGRVGEERYNQSVCLGWMIELLQSFFLVSDDIMDSSITRRGQDCWYRRPGVGMIAINDAFLLESALYVLLKKYFRSHPSYVDLLELFHEVTLQTELGQLCDLITAPEDDVDLSKFSIAKYTFIAVYKTAYYSFYLPVALALHLLQLATPKNLQQSRDILLMMGEYFQVQDDYLDNFGQPEQIGKVGTDIEDNKCSWLINQALLRVSPEQRQVLDANYGSRDKSNVAAVKKVYDELKLEQVYEEYEEKVVGDLRRLVDGVDESEGLKKGVFESFLKKIYRRSK